MTFFYRRNLALAAILFAICFCALALMPQSASAAVRVLTSATSTSNNASTTLAKVGDTVSFQLNLDGGVSATNTPVINIRNMGTTTMTGSAGAAAWTYSTTTTSAWTEGNATFTMAWMGSAGEATSTFASVGSTTLRHVVFDKTVPTLSAVTVRSNNASTTLAKAGDIITLTATSSENIGNPATITIGGNAATFALVTASTTWKGTYTVQSGDTNGDQAISVAFADAAGNSGTTVTSVTSGSLVYTDTVGPVITISGSSPDTVYVSSTPYADAGATATDARDGSTSVSTSGSVDSAVHKTYTITYSSTDAAGNTTSSTRTVDVIKRGGSGGGGGGSSTGATNKTTPPAPATPTTNTTATIDSLRAQLNALLAQIAALTGTATANANAYIHANANASFNRSLASGSYGDDVKALQQYLNSHGYVIAESGPGSPGNETTFFGAGTRAALIKLQEAAGITPAVGVFGPKTRAYVGANP